MITIRDLTKRFDDFTALNRVSFEIHVGETFALLGPNGSGKTTLMRCLVGLSLPSEGTIQVQGLDISRHFRETRRLISYLPQRVAFDESLTAREVLQFYARLRRIDPSRVEEMLREERFHFNGFAEKTVGQFSGGMVQRLGLAVACLPDTPYLLLDEPTVSLDPEGAIRFREYLAALKQQGKTIILSSHTLEDVERLADRVAILVSGKLVAQESMETLRERLWRSSRMRVFLHNTPEQYIQTAQDAGAEEVTIETDSLIIASSPESRFTILRAIEEAGGAITRITTQEVSLEDIYLRYIREGENSHD
jgi:Cu-processing system ATP-binding protein